MECKFNHISKSDYLAEKKIQKRRAVKKRDFKVINDLNFEYNYGVLSVVQVAEKVPLC